MLTVSETTTISRPPEVVFEAAADPQTQLKWDAATLKSVEKLSPGPLGQSARYRGNFKGFGVVEYDFIDYQPPRRFAHRATIKMGEMRHTFVFDPVPEGTRLTQTGELTPSTLGRVLAPVIKPMFRRRFRQIGNELQQYVAG